MMGMLGVLADSKLNVIQQNVLAAQKANCILGYINREVASRERRELSPSTQPL